MQPVKKLFICAVFSLIVLAASQTSFADPVVFSAHLSGPIEVPPNASPGVGFTTVTIDPVAHTLRVQVSFSNLLGTTTASHIHGPTANPFDITQTAGVATAVPSFPGFPLGVTSGSFDSTFNTLDLATYNPAFVSANGGTAASAEAALFSAITSGTAYLNIHSSFRTGGEIRGFLAPVSEPATMVLLGLGLSGIALRLRRGRKA
jgi:hypothetical protein